MAKRKFPKSTKIPRKQTKSRTFPRHSSNPSNKNTGQLALLAKDCEQFITNLSSVNLSPVEKIALGKGLSYVPTPAKPTRATLMSDITTFEKRMRTAWGPNRLIIVFW